MYIPGCKPGDNSSELQIPSSRDNWVEMPKNITMSKMLISKGRNFTLIGFMFILFPLLIWGLWIYSYNAQANQADRQKMYLEYFPEFLRGRYTISFISILLCVLAIFFCSIAWTHKSSMFKFLSVIIMIVGGLTFLLTLFTLL
jgi:hypothetical protein